MSLYTPTDAAFRKYLDAPTWNSRFAPVASDLDYVKAWLESNGMPVPHVASNRLVLEFTGTVAQFNAAFGTTLHVLSRKNPSALTGPIDVYGVTGPLTAPTDVASKIHAIISADLPASTATLPPEIGTIDTAGPVGVGAGYVPAQLATAYGLDPLYAAGSKGDGARLGVVIGAAYKHLDLQSFWQSFGITRADPTIVSLMEPPATRFLESTIDVEWSGSLAPTAPMTVYQGPDSRDTALVYVFDEAIARGEVDVLTISFAHREDSEQDAVRFQLEASAKEAAALGMTVLAAAGDGGKPDVPAVCPHVTAVGGTNLSFGAGGAITETGTTLTGPGPSSTFALPDWQASTVTDSGGKRAVVDVALNAQGAYWVYYLGTWSRYLGTSFSSPVFAGVMTVVDGARTKASKTTAGFLNPALYGSTAVQATFRDIVTGGAAGYPCAAGWDYSTGWGAPNGGALVGALP
ncbi:MAG: S53 family peptidase [Polyangiales bacterium]